MADYTQSATHEFIAHAALTHPSSTEGTPLACASYLEGVIFVKIANVEVTPNATGVMVWIQASPETTGDDAWVTIWEAEGSITAAETEALTATEPVAETSLACASTTNLTVKDDIYIQDASVVADGEWHKIVKVVSNTSITIDYGLAVQKDSSDFIWTEADIYPIPVNCAGFKRINVIVAHEAATGANLHIEAVGIFATAFE